MHIYPHNPVGTAPFSVMLCAQPTDFGALSNYEWQIGGVTVYGNMIPMTYAVPGTYQVRVKATCVDIEARAETTITVRAQGEDGDRGGDNNPPPPPLPNTQPRGSITATPADTKLPAAHKSIDITLRAIASDQDGRIASYRWLSSNSTTSPASVVTRKYKKGTFRERVTVTDDRGATATAEILITVR